MEGISITAVSDGSYPGMDRKKELRFVVHLLDGKPSEVKVDGRNARGWSYDSATTSLTIPVRWNVDKPLSIEIR